MAALKILPARFHFDGAVNWYPGHMARAARVMGETLKNVHTIIECRDARLPISTSNPLIHDSVAGKRRVVVLTKADLCNINMTVVHRDRIKSEKNISHVVLLDALKPTQKSLNDLHAALKSTSTMKQVMMVVGIPNTGKSTLINTLIQEGKKAPVSSTPGWTRGQTLYQLKKLNGLLMDTAGVMAPGVIQPEQGLKLAACGLIMEDVVPGGVMTVVDFLLFTLNQRPKSRTAYRKHYDIADSAPEMEDTYQITPFIAEKFGKKDITAACQHFIIAFRSGLFGRITMDDVKSEVSHLESREGSRTEER